jgi:SAM-dependent methyltransferase
MWFSCTSAKIQPAPKSADHRPHSRALTRRGRECLGWARIDNLPPSCVSALPAVASQVGRTAIIRLVSHERNVCSGPFGAVYDSYIERPRLARLVLGAMWGVDPRPFYRSLRHVAGLPDGATVLDVPCGGGVALRGLRPGQRVRWLGVDIEPAMLARMQRRAALHPDADVQLIEGDMYRLDLEDETADLCLSYGGLHCIARPEDALTEMARCLRPGGRLLGSTFLAHGSRRQRLLLRNQDFGNTGSADDLHDWLRIVGFTDISVDREDGLVVFSATRP